MNSPEAPTRRQSPVESFLGLFAEVRGGEGTTALLLTLNVFLLLLTYYIIKPVREALILAGGGAEVKAYASAGQAVLLLGVVPLYALLASKVSRRRLINVVTLVFVACLVGFYVLAVANVRFLGVAFFLWVGIFNLMIVSQFWAFANDVYTVDQGKRLFAIVAFGASSGAVFGSVIAEALVAPLGVYQMLLVASALLFSTLGLTNVIDARERERREGRRAESKEATQPIGTQGAFRLVAQNRYLLLIGFSLLFLNWVNTTGEYILSRTVRSAADAAIASGATSLTTEEFVAKFYAGFFAWVNGVGLVIQALLVSRILKYLGVRVAILILPVLALGAYALLAVYPVLAIVRWVKIAENSTDYSLNNTVRNVLFLPTTREEKYKAKQAIDTMFVRLGDVLSAGVVFLGTVVLALEARHFALINVGLVAIWIGIAVAIARKYRVLARANEAPQRPAVAQ